MDEKKPFFTPDIVRFILLCIANVFYMATFYKGTQDDLSYLKAGMIDIKLDMKILRDEMKLHNTDSDVRVNELDKKISNMDTKLGYYLPLRK